GADCTGPIALDSRAQYPLTSHHHRERFSFSAGAAPMPFKADLDAIDWKILKELQDNGRMTNVELSRRVGISAPPCLRRVKRLEDAGIIRGYRALLDTRQLGFDVVAFCLIGLHH